MHPEGSLLAYICIQYNPCYTHKLKIAWQCNKASMQLINAVATSVRCGRCHAFCRAYAVPPFGRSSRRQARTALVAAPHHDTAEAGDTAGEGFGSSPWNFVLGCANPVGRCQRTAIRRLSIRTVASCGRRVLATRRTKRCSPIARAGLGGRVRLLVSVAVHMRVLLLGANGNLGRRVAAALLASKEHQVTLYVRNAEKLRAAFSAVQLSTAQACRKQASMHARCAQASKSDASGSRQQWLSGRGMHTIVMHVSCHIGKNDVHNLMSAGKLDMAHCAFSMEWWMPLQFL